MLELRMLDKVASTGADSVVMGALSISGMAVSYDDCQVVCRWQAAVWFTSVMKMQLCGNCHVVSM